jgi:hypothetical protein
MENLLLLLTIFIWVGVKLSISAQNCRFMLVLPLVLHGLTPGTYTVLLLYDWDDFES